MLKSTVLAGIARAKSAVQDLAIPALLVVRTGTFVPGSDVSNSESTSSIKVVLTGFSSKEVDGQRILASDLKGLIFPETGQPVPKANDVIRISSSDYRVIANNKVMAGTDLALSQVQMRLT